MRLNWRKTTAILVLTSHLLVITFANAFHQHGGHGCGGCAEEHQTHHAQAAPCCHHEHASACHATPDASQAPVEATWGQSAEDCPVCQFLAQKWLSVELPEAAGLVEVIWQGVPGRPLRLPATLLYAWQIRGPPVVA